MTTYETTYTIQEEENTYTNDLKNKKIIKNGEIIADYCILDINETVATIMQGNKIQEINIKNSPIDEILKKFENPPKQEKKLKTRKNKKEPSETKKE